jgi:Tol biopolymer transport system component
MRNRQSIMIVACALALAAGVVLAASARATFSGPNGRITFAHGGEIFVMNPDASGLQQLTSGTADCEAPSISPDGKTIVFVHNTPAGSEIRAMTASGANQRHLATGWCGWPSFSPNGKQVVFTCRGQVWVMNATGSHQRRLTPPRGNTERLFPTYSRDGKTIVFVAQVFVSRSPPRERCEILAMNFDGSHLRRLAYTTGPDYLSDTPTFGFSFSPDGKKIAYSACTTTSEVLRVMNADGTDQRLLPRSYGFTFPCYSPDGRQILCVNGHSQVSVARADGSRWRQLTHISGGVGWAPNWGPLAR